MIDVDGVSKFFSIVDDLMKKLDTNETREDVMRACVEDRLSSILKLQANEFDEQLDILKKSMDLDLKDEKNLKYVGNMLASLHKCIALDRIRLIDNLIELNEVELHE